MLPFFSEARGPNFMRALSIIFLFSLLALRALKKKNSKSNLKKRTHLRQIILSWLYLRARICSDGSMMPPRRRRTRWSIDSFWML